LQEKGYAVYMPNQYATISIVESFTE